MRSLNSLKNKKIRVKNPFQHLQQIAYNVFKLFSIAPAYAKYIIKLNNEI